MQNPKINKIINLIEKKKYDKAEILFKRIIKEFPNDENIKYIYFDALFKMRQFDNILAIIKKLNIYQEDLNILKLKALCYLEKNLPLKSIDCLNKIIDHQPEPIIYNYLGVANAKIKKNDEAEKLFLKSILLGNNDLTLIRNYINYLRDIYQNTKAIEFLNNQYDKNKNPELIVLIIAILMDEKKHNEALKYFDIAEEFFYNNRNFQFIKGVIFSELGEKNKAIKIFEKLIERENFFGPAYRLLSLLKYQIDSDILQSIEDYLNQSETDELNDIHLGLALSNFLEDNGEFKKSFFYLKKYNSKYRKIIKFDQQKMIDDFSKVKIFFKNLLKEKINVKITGQKNPIFILGMPRSSTSLVEQIISSHSDVFGCGELTFIERESFELFEDKLDLEKIKSFKERYLSMIDNISDESSFFTDKAPLNFLFIGIISIIFPESKIILCEKNRMDNLNSIYRNFFPSGVDFSYDLDDLIFFNSFYDKVISFWEKEQINFYRLKYESLVDNFTEEVNELFKFLRLDNEEKCYEFHKTKRVVNTASFSQVRKPLFKESINRWKNYEKELQKVSLNLSF